MKRSRNHVGGMTLIELIIAMVVVGICIVGALAVLSSMSMRSAAAMTRTQARAIAASYLEDILSRTYAQVAAYPGRIDPGARDANGAMIAGLESYRVQIINRGVNLGVPPDTTAARRIDIVVTDLNGRQTRLTGYRTSYAGQVLY